MNAALGENQTCASGVICRFVRVVSPLLRRLLDFAQALRHFVRIRPLSLRRGALFPALAQPARTFGRVGETWKRSAKFVKVQVQIWIQIYIWQSADKIWQAQISLGS